MNTEEMHTFADRISRTWSSLCRIKDNLAPGVGYSYVQISLTPPGMPMYPESAKADGSPKDSDVWARAKAWITFQAGTSNPYSISENGATIDEALQALESAIMERVRRAESGARKTIDRVLELRRDLETQ